MTNGVATTQQQGEVIEAVIAKGDLSRLSAEQRTQFYYKVCESLGLNPLTQPFEYINLSGKLRLYAKRDACDQLRKIRGISVEILSQKHEGGMLTVHVRAKDKTGRSDEDIGSVPLPQAAPANEAKANTLMKAVTKAKRRVTLSIAGLGYLDEVEIDDIAAEASAGRPAAVMHSPAPPAANAMAEQADQTEILSEHDRRLTRAATQGMATLEAAWKETPAPMQHALKQALERRYKIVAQAVDASSTTFHDPETGEVKE